VDRRDLGTDPAARDVVTEPGPASLPPRPPRSLAVHWLVDSAVVFVGVLFLALVAGFSIVPVAIGALVVGAIAAPFTRRAEIRALAAREATRSDDTSDRPPEGA
jgi:hypothetical protein